MLFSIRKMNKEKNIGKHDMITRSKRKKLHTLNGCKDKKKEL